MNFSSRKIELAVEEISRLPGIGKKTALRLALHLLRRPAGQTESLSAALLDLRNNTTFCSECHTISDTEICSICSSPKRDKSIVCIVEDVRDVMAIENTGGYSGVYHVLGGLISPMDGIGPSDLTIDALIDKMKTGEVKEVVFALNTTMEGDTTNFYLYRKIKDFGASLTTIARGIAVGDELEFADEVTLGRSIQHRIPYEQSLPQ
ncbi:MAG: recombination mediator RecR [Schleiferiaceae bacterium]|jgi:recombination protein RecR|nr:MAG: recombination protein RecR [Bacteroidota bacterium]REK50712.1 MAG: recombination protein RecR [Bacteroidota bacterium]